MQPIKINYKNMVTLTKIVIQYVIGGGYWYQLPNGKYIYINDEDDEEEGDSAFV